MKDRYQAQPAWELEDSLRRRERRRAIIGAVVLTVGVAVFLVLLFTVPV